MHAVTLKDMQAEIRFNLQMSGFDEYEAAEKALGRLGYAMIEQDHLTDAPRQWAIQQLIDEVSPTDDTSLDTLLERYESTGLLQITEDKIGFVRQFFVSYFAAVHLEEIGLKDKIAPPVLLPMNPDSLFGKQIGKWEHTIMVLTGLAPDASQYLMEIAAIDPFLAAICIQNGAERTPEAYQYVKARLWRIAQEPKTIERRQAMVALYLIGDVSDFAEFQHVLNTDRDFDVRITAANAVARLGGVESIPTLLETFHRITEADVLDSSTARHQMCWAIASLGEQAALPLLEALLNETDFLKRFDLLVGLMKIANPEVKPSADLLTALGKPDAFYNGYVAETLMTALEQIASPEALHHFEAWRKQRAS